METTNTQLGEVIDEKKILGLPLNGRSYIDLFGLQTGVAPTGTRGEGPGTVSVNGQRENSNGFLVNGGDVSGAANFEAGVQPNLDAVQEFRLITNGFDAEYGRFSGAIMNTITKSGTNSIHGSVFEFLRNDDLDARGFFDTGKGALKKNQYGYAVGGPAIKNRLFWFTDYQGDRTVNGGTASQVPVLSNAERQGDVGVQNLTGTVTGAYWAQVLSQRLGRPVQVNEPYSSVFPDGKIPDSAFSPATKGTIGFIPVPNVGDNIFASSAVSRRSVDHKVGQRVDFLHKMTGTWSGYYYFDDFSSLDPYGASSFPTGFGSDNRNRNQLGTLSNTHVFSPTAVNDFRLGYIRIVVRNVPAGIVAPDLSALGFVTGAGTLGINNAGPTGYKAVPSIGLNNFGFGDPGTGNAIQNTYQIGDNFSKIHGRHTIKLGADFRYYQMNNRNGGGFVGGFGFSGGETGYDVADYLLGAPSSYSQSTPQVLDGRSRYGGIYAQDSIRLRSNLTLNLGLRWEYSTPWYDTQNKIVALVPGLQSTQYPNAPTGLVYPGDPGIPKTLAPTRYNNFAPRFGLAYSPNSHRRRSGQDLWRTGQDQHSSGIGHFLHRHSRPDAVLDSRNRTIRRILGVARADSVRRAFPNQVHGRVSRAAIPLRDSGARKRCGQELRLQSILAAGQYAGVRHAQQAPIRDPLQFHDPAPAQRVDGTQPGLRGNAGPQAALHQRSQRREFRPLFEPARFRGHGRNPGVRTLSGRSNLHTSGRQHRSLEPGVPSAISLGLPSTRGTGPIQITTHCR